MQILKINPITIFNQQQARRADYSRPYGLRMQKPIEKDTVSFKGTVKFENFIEKTVANNNKNLSEIATIYMDVLESIATKLKDFGVSFDREYCEPNAIKSVPAVLSKMKRQKTFKILDRVRATLYCKNIYDLSILFYKILPELAKRGYIVAYTEMPLQQAIIRGYTPNEDEIKNNEAMCPDVDIRLDRALLQTDALPLGVIHFIGKPQMSGYEDIQIRLIKQGPKKLQLSKNPFHELIILTGPEYAKTKHEESKRIYSYTRQFKELHIFNHANSETLELIKRYTDLISKIFSTEISQKIYENAKNYDIFGIKKRMPISLSTDDEKILTSYYDSIEKLTKEYYKTMISAKSKNEKAKHTLEVEKKEDLERLAVIRKGLSDAVEYYRNYPYDKKENKKSFNKV